MCLQDIGYKGEIGYQTFLYSNEPEIRSLLMFLVEKLPRESAEASDQPIGTLYDLLQEPPSNISAPFKFSHIFLQVNQLPSREPLLLLSKPSCLSPGCLLTADCHCMVKHK